VSPYHGHKEELNKEAPHLTLFIMKTSVSKQSIDNRVEFHAHVSANFLQAHDTATFVFGRVNFVGKIISSISCGLNPGPSGVHICVQLNQLACLTGCRTTAPLDAVTYFEIVHVSENRCQTST
jgi:hypothetical protein